MDTNTTHTHTHTHTQHTINTEGICQLWNDCVTGVMITLAGIIWTTLDSAPMT
jgi:hypothetical protein